MGRGPDGKPDGEPDGGLDAVRAEIDALDEELVGLISRRQRCVERAGVLKRGQPVSAVRAPARVEAVVARARDLAESRGASPDLVEAVYRVMIDQFILLEGRTHAGDDQAP